MNETHHDIDIELPEHDCLYETTNENGFIDVEPAYRKSTVLRLIEADRKRIAELESANAELERLCDETYVAQGANAYNLACEEMEGWQAKRRKAGKEVGTTGSLCDGIQWLYSYIEELEAKRRGEPVGYFYPWELDRSLKAYPKGFPGSVAVYASPQPLSESDMPDEPDLVRCAECGAEMIQVRPGKWQHPDCSQSSWAADLVSKTDWNNELSSWSDEDFIRIFHECPDLANRLRKMLAEPVKGVIYGPNGFIATTTNPEPVKVDAEASVPSDTDIDELSREWGLASAAYPSKSMVRDFARALLARYK